MSPKFWTEPLKASELTQRKITGAESWSRYWRSGYQDTCFFADRSFAVAHFWKRYFKGFGQSARIVDLATGNGAVAFMALRYARENQREFDILGVDFADIIPTPEALLDTNSFPSIRFYSNTDICSLPLADNSVDGSTSQFGIEYAHMQNALVEVARVLKPGGSFCFLIHVKNGAVYKASAERMRRARNLFNEGHLFDLLFGLVLATKDRSVQRIEKFRKRISARVSRVLLGSQDIPKDDLIFAVCREATYLAERASANRSDELARHAKYMAEEVTAYVQRLSAMLQASHSERDMRYLWKDAEKIGFESLSYEAFEVQEQHVAWAFEGKLNQRAIW